jgi:hypothetical protein
VIHILLDTTTYRADPRREKAGFRVLTQLLKSGLVQVHLPEFVESEFKSQEKESLDESYANAEKALVALKKRAPGVGEIADLHDKLGAIKTRLYHDIETSLRDWIVECRGEIHPVKPEHGARVVSAYFGGSGSFSKPKSRDDFPDAFIYETVADLANSVARLFFVSGDFNLRHSVASLKGVEVFESLNSLLLDNSLVEAAQRLKTQEQLELLRKNLPYYSRELKGHLDYLFLNNLKYRQISDPHFRSEGQTAEIEELDEIESVEIGDDVELLGADTLLVPFSCRVGALVHYAISIAEYESLDDYEAAAVSVYEEENAPRGSLEASEHVTLLVEGRISLTPDFTIADKVSDPSEDFSPSLNGANFALEELGSIEIQETLE